jgi:hypothetical protein
MASSDQNSLEGGGENGEGVELRPILVMVSVLVCIAVMVVIVVIYIRRSRPDEDVMAICHESTPEESSVNYLDEWLNVVSRKEEVVLDPWGDGSGSQVLQDDLAGPGVDPLTRMSGKYSSGYKRWK